MKILIATVDAHLRGKLAPGHSALATNSLMLIVSLGVLYGATMGSYAGMGPERWLHLLYTAAKVPLLLLVTFAISWPSFAVANHLAGLGNDLKTVFRLLLSCQCVVVIALASLAPLTAFWYFSIRDYKLALLFNSMVFMTASFAGQYAMRQSYRALIYRNRRHAAMLWVWIVIYSFVGIQLAWVLRPFVGSPAEVIQFFRSGSLSNAYVRIAELLWGAISGG